MAIEFKRIKNEPSILNPTHSLDFSKEEEEEVKTCTGGEVKDDNCRY